MGTRLSGRRVVAVVGSGAAVALLALITTPQASTAQPLVGAAGLAGGGYGAAYLEMDGVTPASPPTDHSKDIALRSMGWKVSSAAAIGGQSGSGVAKVTVGAFTLTKALDASTTQLLSAVATGRDAPHASIFLVRRAANGTQLEALEYDLKDAIITDDEQSTDAGGTETVVLQARSITETYFTGTTAGTPVSLDENSPG